MKKIVMKKYVLSFKPLLVLAVATAMLFGNVVSTQSQELSPDHLALARKYVDLTDTSQLYERTLINTGIKTMRTIVAQNPELSDPVGDAIGEVIKFYSGEKDQLFEQFARIYALRFSVEELVAITEFYETDTGQKLAGVNATINADLSGALEIFQVNLNTEFYSKVRAELRAKDINI